MEIKKGNYVRCPLDVEEIDFRDYIIGKVYSIDDFSNTATVVIEDIEDTKKYFERVPNNITCNFHKISRIKILDGTLAIYIAKGGNYVVKIISFYEEIDGYYSYYAYRYKQPEIIEIVSEKDLEIQFDSGSINPLDQMKNYELHNPVWYKGRSNVSKMNIALENSPLGIELLLGSRVYLFKHQMETIMQGLTLNPCRIMLADEVGLGKTIEACVIYKGLKERNFKFRTLIVVPKSLVNQWQNELSYKFWIDIKIWDGLSKSVDSEIIVPLEELDEFNKINSKNNYDLFILDETHKLLKDKKTYDIIHNYTENIENIILLSATPIQQREVEYLQLLKLLDPSKYNKMNSDEFENLLDKNKRVKDDIYELVRDLIHYEEDEAGEYYVEDFTDMNDYLKDPILNKLISEIDMNDNDKGLKTVRIILAYISNTYEIEKNIIRNRRMEIKDRFSKRTKNIVNYRMYDSLDGFYEEETYSTLIEYLKCRFEGEQIDIDLVKDLYGRMLSSPWALEGILKELINSNKNDNSLKLLKELQSFNELWLNANLEELGNMEYYEGYPDEIKGRLLLAMDILDEEYYDKKVVVFTKFTETALEFSKYLKKKIGESSVELFTENMSAIELEESVNRFQEYSESRVIVCDKTGGEGRNLQMADAILHLDIPWNPVDLEQRIGRLDRIGRDSTKEVESIIMMSEDTIETDIFKLWDKGLNIFEESLSGIEIALNDIETEIESALNFDIEYGIKNSLDNIHDDILNMKDEVEREKYYDYAKSIDSNKENKVNKIIEKFDGEDSEVLKHTMLTWFELAGFSPEHINVKNSKGENDLIIKYSPKSVNPKSIQNALFAPPDTKEALKRSRKAREIRGTFSKDLAINMEDLILFSPGDEIFDSININALKSYKGRSSAVAIKTDVNWLGFAFTWNIKFNKNYLLSMKINPNMLDVNYSDYLPLEQYQTYQSITKSSSEISDDDINKKVDNWLKAKLNSVKTVHLGKRGLSKKVFDDIGSEDMSNLDWLRLKLPEEKWVEILDDIYDNSKAQAIAKAEKEIQVSRAKEDLEDMVISGKARNIYYTNDDSIIIDENKEKQEENLAIIKGLEDPVIELDSISLIWMVK